MTIENELKRIADSLEQLVAMQQVVDITDESAPSIKPAEVPAAAPPAPPPAAQKEEPHTTQLTRKELNDALGVEAERLGGADKIFALMGAEPFNATGIDSIYPSQWKALIDAVKGIQA